MIADIMQGAEQKLKIEQQDVELQKQRIQIENLTQAILHAKKKMFGSSLVYVHY
jgi:hypothetical protein